jgi:glutathione synthase/RimK-type ligase-like ATP-grasp enzyme
VKNILFRRKGLGFGSCTKIAAISKTGLQVVRNDELLENDYQTVIRWGCTSKVGGKTFVNKVEPIHLVCNKTIFRKVLKKEALNTIPSTWFDADNVPDDVLETGVIVRPEKHAQGNHIYLVHNENDLEDAVQKCGGNYYISSYIKKVAEYRVTFVSGRVAWVANKTPADPDAVAWNVSQGGKFENVKWGSWPIETIRTSLIAFNQSGLDFGGVDVMVDADGKSYVLEINSAPSHTSDYRIKCMAKAFDYVVENGPDKIPVDPLFKHWSEVIHPEVAKGVDA